MENEILEYTFSIFDISKEQKLLHISHKIRELLCVRKKEEVLTEQNKICFAEYSDLIEKMKRFYDANKNCLLLHDIKTITFRLFKCFDNCFNDIFYENNKVFPIFKVNIKEFLSFEIYKHISSKHMRFFFFLYLEKFLYSFPIFSFKNKINPIISNGIFLFNFDQLDINDVEQLSFYLFLEDVNYVLSIIAPIYISIIIFYKSEILKDQFHKIFKLIKNKNCRKLFIETEEKLRQFIKTGSAYTQHQIGRKKTGISSDCDNILCSYSEFFLLKHLFQENHTNTKQYAKNRLLKNNVICDTGFQDEGTNALCHEQSDSDNLNFDDIFILEHINYKKIHKLIQKEVEKEKAIIEEEKKMKQIHLSKNGENYLKEKEKEKIQLFENEMSVETFNLNYFKEAAIQYNSNLFKKKEAKRKIVNFIAKTNDYENQIKNERNSSVHFSNIIFLNKKKQSEKKKERVYVDLKKTNCDLKTCIYKDNLNYIGNIDSLIRESTQDCEYIKPDVPLSTFTYGELPYEIQKNACNIPSIDVTRKSLQLRGFH